MDKFMLNLIVALGITLGLIIIIIILGYKTPVFRRGVKNSLILFTVGLIMYAICFWAVNQWQKGHNVPLVVPLASGVIGLIFTAIPVLRIIRWLGVGKEEGDYEPPYQFRGKYPPRRKKCPYCKGSGKLPAFGGWMDRECPHCDGVGWYYVD